MSERPNFLFIITDQQRADHLGCYGNRVLKTPSIDSIAARGVAFDRFYAASPVCMPNRATLMTGRMPSLHGVRCNGIPLHFGNVVFTDLLRAAGYRTALIGKCHLQNMTDREPIAVPAQGKGSDRSAAFPEARRAVAVGAEYEQERRSSWRRPGHRISTPYYGFDHVELCNDHGDAVFGDYDLWLAERHADPDRLRGPGNAISEPRYDAPQAWRTRVPEELYSTHYVAEQSVAWLKNHARTGDGTPFFLQASFPDPHHPFTPPGRYWDAYRPADIELPPTGRAPADTAPPHVRGLHSQQGARRDENDQARPFAVNEREAREITALTYGMVRMIDDRVGMLLAALQETGYAENTVVIFTSDHGDFMGDHGLMLKGPMHYQGLVRVPFIWAEPSGGGGHRCDGLAGTIDIARTLLERAGIGRYNGVQGRSLLQSMTGVDDAGAEAMLVEEDYQRSLPGFTGPIRLRTLISRGRRLSLYRGVAWGEFYDLDNDPHEERNLWGEASCAVERNRLMQLLAHKMMEACDSSPLPTRRA